MTIPPLPTVLAAECVKSAQVDLKLVLESGKSMASASSWIRKRVTRDALKNLGGKLRSLQTSVYYYNDEPNGCTQSVISKRVSPNFGVRLVQE